MAGENDEEVPDEMPASDSEPDLLKIIEEHSIGNNIALVYKSRLAKNFMNDKNVELRDWPAYSPDLNVIEKMWELPAPKVYVGARECQMVLELKNTILLVWETLDQP
ncbi:Transposable element Tc3 transposase [Porphyridium purpureum]|uniref:Transposable element Tc3 transposase n=1 Tax=Porphyridium purpureum TaxID=35688 RepID=A0A5J4YWB7_PORPP|nr:Transposable element Tc3 transposase [Porphyridium purpureum]|eukprot:POR3676..scf209_3